MAQAGTLLSDLDSKAPVFSNKDDDLVNKILTDMNIPSQSNPIMNPHPPSGGNGRIISTSNPNSTYPVAMDPATATAHMIGKDYPTSADFAHLMNSQQFSQGGGGSHGGSQFANVPSHTIMTQQQPTLIESVRGSMYSDIFSQIKQPIFVAIIIFVVSLPIINVLIGHYLPSFLRIGGDLTTAGLGVKALIGGFLFWFIQKILVPLMAV